MKKIICMIMMLITTPVMAENWKIVADINNEEGDRLLVDIDSLDIFNNNNEGFLKGTFKIFGQGRDPVQAIISFNVCEAGSGILRIFPAFGAARNRKPKEFFYSKEGTKVYDSVGNELCRFLEVTYKVWLEQKQKADPKS